MDAHQNTELDTCPISARGIIERAYLGECSPRGAIKAFCLRCVGYIRGDVTDCVATACPLHHFRPYQGAENDQGVAEAARDRTQVALEADE